MTEARAEGARAPIALQLVLLLLVSLIAAQAMAFAVIVLMPPPQRAIYRIEEVAQALKGGSLSPRYGRPLTRVVQAQPPPMDATARDGEAFDPRRRTRDRLAQMLGVSPADVRLQEKPPLSVLGLRARFVDRRLRAEGGEAGPRPGPMGEPPPGEGDFIMRRPGQEPPPGPRRIRFAGGEFDGGPPLFNGFVAAVRQADGQWVVVRPRPEPFPNDWQRRLMLWLAGSLVVVAPLGVLFARRITAPLREFAAAAEALGRDPRAPMMPLKGPAEIGQAAAAFNRMQERLKRYVDDRTAMMGAISHDLRTPLARIRFKLEGASDPLRQAVVADLEQMEQMIASVLAFIRYASDTRPRERLDLLSLVEVLVDDAVEVGQDVTLGEAGPAVVEADALGLQRLFRNLIENAVKYGERARVSLRVEGQEAVVEVADDGPGLAPSELERVFQPFYRADQARTLDGSGVGLGLAVARSLARAHGGDVQLRSGSKGLIAEVRLPLSAT